MLNIAPDCEDFLKDCWWRNVPQNCCDIFELQKTEYGICYSFNSMVSEKPSINESTVRKVTAYGSRSGLMATIELGYIMFPPSNCLLISLFYSGTFPFSTITSYILLALSLSTYHFHLSLQL